MGQFLPMRSQNILIRTREALNIIFNCFGCTFFCVDRCLFRSDASALGFIENKGSGTGKLMGFAIYAIIKLITSLGVFVIEESVGAVTLWINTRFRLLDIFAISAFYIERIITFFLIRIAVLEKEAVGAKLSLRDAIYALIIEVALFGIGKEPVIFGTPEVGGIACGGVGRLFLSGGDH